VPPAPGAAAPPQQPPGTLTQPQPTEGRMYISLTVLVVILLVVLILRH
jgi:hypothetical protein